MESVNNLFIIDDDPLTIELFTAYLKAEVPQIHSFTDPEKALASMDELDPQVLILDYMMPTMKGDQFMVDYSKKKLFSERYVILVTSYDLSEEDKKLFESLGVNKTLLKPVSQEDLINSLKDIC